ncbi:MAG: maleylpyruvate isomerase N-terminal domain-containing protein [Acidimicrobiales bacterium]
MTRAPGQHAVVEQYRSGVRAIEETASQLDDTSWHRQACGEWTAEETARHVLTVAGWYHHWLDRALEGNSSVPFEAKDMDLHTAAALTGAGDLDGHAAVTRYVVSADRYAERVLDHWDLPYGYPGGVVTAGLHLGVAATEWHIHAWDLSGPTGTRHRPEDPAGLFDAAASCVAASQRGVTGWAMSAAIPVGRRIKPWETLLRRTGRSPNVDD